MRAHPAADVFPMMTDGELDALAKDIAAHGQHTPIVTIDGGGEWLILDGRNRYEACRRAGVHPSTTVFSGAEPIAFVVSCNLHRRHLDSSQRAMIAEKLATIKHGATAGKDQKGRFSPEGSKETPSMASSREEAARLLNVSVGSLARARRVRERAVPELVAAVESGAVSVTAAAIVATLPVEEQHRLVANGTRAVVERAHHREPELQAPRLVVHNGGVSTETKPGVFQQQKQKLYDLSASTNWRTRHDDHAAVLRLLEKGMRFAEIAEETGLEDQFVHHSMAPYRIRPKVMAKVIEDMQATAETWASWTRRIEEKWPGASRKEKDQLIEQLEACRRSAGAFIRGLKKDARIEGETA